jgi:hypothetical protein
MPITDFPTVKSSDVTTAPIQTSFQRRRIIRLPPPQSCVFSSEGAQAAA